RKHKQLSDGQKYRYAIAKMLATGSDVWFIDEFCATLDREMAKVIAFSIQKTARLLGKTIIVATTHSDIEHDLNASLTIKKNFGEGVTVTRNKWEKRPCSLMNEITFRISTFEEYQKSKYYLPEDVLTFLEKYLNTTIRDKNKFYLRDENSDKESE
ncbi:hypothetical protein LCGC14_2392460, partial [marine sediment metagenome]